MIKVLIADSDTESAKNFQAYLKTSFPDIKQIVTTSDVLKDIMDTVKAVKPRLVVADIRFFGVSNIQKIRAIYDRYPSIRFILYGTYNDAAYMQKASEYGVLDVMYRPVKQAEFHKAVSHALAYFKKADGSKAKEDRIVKLYEAKKPQFAEIFLNSLLQGQIKNETEIYYTLKYFGLQLKPPFTVFIVHIDHFKKVMLTLDEREKHLLIFNMLHIVERGLSGRAAKAMIGNFNVINAIVSGAIDLDEFIALCDDMKKQIYIETGIRVTIGVGRTYESPMDISVSYKEALGTLRYRIYMGFNAVIHISFADPMNNITYRYPSDREDKLIYAAAVGEYEYSVVLLREIFDALKACEPLPEMYLSKVIMSILISINRTLGEQNTRIQTNFSTFFPSREVLELGDDIEGAFNYLSAALKNFCEHIAKNREKNDDAIITGAREYIDQKYYETFSMTKIATELNTTPEYLNRCFSERTGMTPFEYMVDVRVAKAKTLMRETDFDDDMVAVKVGYDDGRHFRSIFQGHEKMTTGEYRAGFGQLHK